MTVNKMQCSSLAKLTISDSFPIKMLNKMFQLSDGFLVTEQRMYNNIMLLAKKCVPQNAIWHYQFQSN